MQVLSSFFRELSLPSVIMPSNKESDDQNKQKEKKNKDNKGKKNEETKSDAEKNNNERLSYNPFANFDFKLLN